jgi:hypothetical protein
LRGGNQVGANTRTFWRPNIENQGRILIGIDLAPRDGLFGASRLTLRVALRAIAAAARRRRTVLFYVGGSNYDRAATEAIRRHSEFFMSWLPGTDSNRRPTD